jgi:transcriptional regulator NrdR family protein
MRCPVCACEDTSVFNSRPQPQGVIYRRRRCESCTHRFTTVEVIKQDCMSLMTPRGSVRPLTNWLLSQALTGSIGLVLTNLVTCVDAVEHDAVSSESRKCAS